MASMRGDASFDLREVDDTQATEMVRSGKARAAAVIPKGFGEAAPNALFRPGVKKPEIEVRAVQDDFLLREYGQQRREIELA